MRAGPHDARVRDQRRPPQSSGPGPRYRGAVCAIAKDENRYVLEWTAYHLALGFDHVFHYDNLSGQPRARS